MTIANVGAALRGAHSQLPVAADRVQADKANVVQPRDFEALLRTALEGRDDGEPAITVRQSQPSVVVTDAVASNVAPATTAAVQAEAPSQPEAPVSTAGFQPDGSILTYSDSGWIKLVPLGPSGVNGGTAYGPASAAPTTDAATPAGVTAGFQPDGSILTYSDSGWVKLVPLGPSGINGGTAYGPDPTAPAPALGIGGLGPGIGPGIAAASGLD